jgi:peptide/nickel transport system substrate-binding protein
MGTDARQWSRRDALRWAGGSLAAAAVSPPVTAILAACGQGGGASQVRPKKGGHLVFGGSDMDSLNPLLAGFTTSMSMSRLMFDPLLNFDNQQNPVPLLAQSVPTMSPDQLTYTFTLRSGLKWTDGQPLTADDVVWTYQLISDPRYAGFNYPLRSLAAQYIDSVTASGPNTVVMKTKQVYAPFLLRFGTVPILPKHVLGSMTAKEINTADFNSNPTVSSGMMKFDSWQKGTSVNLVRNPDYYRGPAMLDGVVNRVLGSTAVPTLLTGEVDISYTIQPADVARLSSSDVVRVVTVDAPLYFYVAFNQDPAKKSSKLFSDVNVRKALMLAVDRKSLGDAIYLKTEVVPDSMIWKSSWAYNPSTTPKYPFDRAKAESMLDAAGWKKNASGVRENGGIELSFEMHVSADHQDWVHVAEVLQQQWRAIGVTMTPKPIDHALWVSEITSTRPYDSILMLLSWGGQDPDQSGDLSSTGVYNSANWKNADMDRMLQSAVGTLDKSKRKQTYASIQNLAADQLPMLPIIYTTMIWGVNKRLHGMQLGNFTQFSNWYWMKDVWVSSGA